MYPHSHNFENISQLSIFRTDVEILQLAPVGSNLDPDRSGDCQGHGRLHPLLDHGGGPHHLLAAHLATYLAWAGA